MSDPLVDRLARPELAEGSRFRAECAIVIGDSHFVPSEVEQIGRLARFVREETQGADLLFLLGDLFDYWMGRKHPPFAKLDELREALDEARRRERPLRCIFVNGNRDFLLDDVTARQFGIEAIGDWAELEIGDKRWLLTHGDLLCVGDSSYMRMRRAVRSRWFAWLSRNLPVALVRYIARRFRAGSLKKQAERIRSGEVRRFPVRPSWVRAVMERGPAETGQGGPWDGLVVGHFHIARHWRLDAGEGTAFVVLPAFEDAEGYLRLEAAVPPRFGSSAPDPLPSSPRAVPAEAEVFEQAGT